MSRTVPTRPRLSAADGPPRVSPLFARTPFRVQLICALLVISSVGWRRGVYFSGGLDSVVVAKAVLTLLALVLAITAQRRAGAWQQYRGTPVLWMGAYLLIACIGGLLGSSAFPSVVLAGRLALVATVVVVTLHSYRWQHVVNGLASSMLGVALVAAVTGLPNLASEGRLYGGIPSVSPNEICLLTSVAVICLGWSAVNGLASTREIVAIVPLLGLVILTGSRTGAAALLLAMMLIVVMAPRIPTPVLGLCLLSVPATIYVTFFTPYVTAFAGRGDFSEVATLSSRTVAWNAALNYPETLTSRLVGEGLAVRKIPVSAMYRNEQILDSTWISALVQTGVIGTTIIALFVLAVAGKAAKAPAPMRSLAVGMLVFTVVTSFLESGMFDTKVAFLLFFTTAMILHRTPRAAETP
jgi:hypothetical protein